MFLSLEDAFNLYGIRQYIPNFTECYELMMDITRPSMSFSSSSILLAFSLLFWLSFFISLLAQEREEKITPSTVILYGLIHQRFALTEEGTYMIVWCLCCRSDSLRRRSSRRNISVSALVTSARNSLYSPYAPSLCRPHRLDGYFHRTKVHLLIPS